LETNPVIQLSEPNFDLLAAIKKEIKASPLVWEYQYIEGHQDDHKAFSELEKWSQMNVEANALAKGLIPIAKTSPRHFCIPNEPWSIWFSSKKLLQLQTQIYDIVYSPEARAYWQEKDKTAQIVTDIVDWRGIGTALNSLPRSRQHFITKFTVGMCGVGK